MAYERKTYDLFISDELRDILSIFESESVVASLLLKRRHDKEDLVDNPVNFISISREDRTKISYLTSERMSLMDISEYWTSSKRFQAKPGAFISKIFKNISAKEIERFSNLFRANLNAAKFDFSVVKGNSILRYYHWESYASDRGTLGASCMKHDTCQNFLDIYTENPDTVSMLIMKNDDGYLLGRALLWNFDSYKIMDRIYTVADEELVFHFKSWATKNGYLYKSEQNWYNTLQFEQLGQKKQELQLTVKLNNFLFRKYPYVDTFKFFNLQTGELTNFMPSGSKFKTLCSSEGSFCDHDYLAWDSIDKVLRHRNDVVFIDYLSIHTHSCNASWSDVNGQYILNKHASYLQDIEDMVFTNDYYHLNDLQSIEKRRKAIQAYNKIANKNSNPIDTINQLLELDDLNLEDLSV